MVDTATPPQRSVERAQGVLRSGSGSPRWFLLVPVVALLLPLLWVLVTQRMGPDDGTQLSPTISLGSSWHWQSGPVVQQVYGDRHGLQVGDAVYAVDGVLFANPAATNWPTRHAGETVQYQVLRQDRSEVVTVTLQPFPLWERLRSSWDTYVLLAVSFAVGAVVFLRRPRDRAAQLILAVPAFNIAGTAAFPLGLRVIDLAGGRGVWVFVVAEISNALMWATFLHFTLVFPEPLPWLRRHPTAVGWVYVLPFALYGLVLAIVLPSARGGLFHLEHLIAVSTASARVVPLLLTVALLLAYRRTRDLEMRQRMRWVVISLIAALTFYVAVGQVPDVLVGRPLLDWGLIQLGFIICPLAIAAAILRYRLFDIELIVKRSLVYAGLTVGLAAIYLATLAGLTQWFPSRSPVIALVAGSLVALCFHPLRARLQRRVSRLIYGARDDPYEVVSQLSELDAAVAPRAALTRVVDTLAQTLRLSYVAIELRHGGGLYETSVGSGGSRGDPTRVPLVHAGDTVGHLLLDVMPGREPFGPADRRLLDDVARQVSRLAGVVLLNSALQLSRIRLVSAREEERRRLHRDLHDGIGPTLAAQAMQLDVARTVLRTDPAAAQETLNRLAAGTKNVLGEIRRIVDDLRPRALDQLGLVSAIREKSAPFAHPNGANNGLQVDVDASDVVLRLPAAVEVAAYRITLEAITNAARHGSARHCHVVLREDHDVLLVQVRDDGTGLPPHYTPGVGLRSMRERTAELGGSFTAQSDPAGGTLITAHLPLPDPDETEP